MHLSSLAVAALAVLLGGAAARAALPTTPTGRWLTEDRSGVIEIGPCGNGSLCGRIVGIALDHPTDPLPTNYLGHTQCHLTLIRDALLDGSNYSARIQDPRDGTDYDATLRLDDQHRLRLRGFIGIPLFGQTQIWTAYPGPVPPDCRMHAPPL